MKRTNPEKTKIGRVMLTRIGELGMYFRRYFGLNLVKKHKYFMEFPDDFDRNEIERIVYLIRGEKYKPAIFIHGVMPRSGTNYLADLMERHEDIFPYTHHFWEFPLLMFTENVSNLQSDFNRKILRYPAEAKPFEFSAYLNAGMMKNLQEQADTGKMILFKYPFVQYLDLFRTFFPRDYLILVLRDGRDVVASSIRTFGMGPFKKKFSDYCREWDYATRCILKYDHKNSYNHPKTIVIKYEDLYQDPEKNIRRILRTLNLDPQRFDFQDLRSQPIRGSSALPNEKGKVTWKPQERKDTFNPLGRWANWTNSQKRRFKALAGRSLVAAGYANDNDW